MRELLECILKLDAEDSESINTFLTQWRDLAAKNPKNNDFIRALQVNPSQLLEIYKKIPLIQSIVKGDARLDHMRAKFFATLSHVIKKKYQEQGLYLGLRELIAATLSDFKGETRDDLYRLLQRLPEYEGAVANMEMNILDLREIVAKANNPLARLLHFYMSPQEKFIGAIKNEMTDSQHSLASSIMQSLQSAEATEVGAADKSKLLAAEIKIIEEDLKKLNDDLQKEREAMLPEWIKNMTAIHDNFMKEKENELIANYMITILKSKDESGTELIDDVELASRVTVELFRISLLAKTETEIQEHVASIADRKIKDEAKKYVGDISKIQLMREQVEQNALRAYINGIKLHIENLANKNQLQVGVLGGEVVKHPNSKIDQELPETVAKIYKYCCMVDDYQYDLKKLLNYMAEVGAKAAASSPISFFGLNARSPATQELYSTFAAATRKDKPGSPGRSK